MKLGSLPYGPGSAGGRGEKKAVFEPAETTQILKALFFSSLSRPREGTTMKLLRRRKKPSPSGFPPDRSHRQVSFAFFLTLKVTVARTYFEML